MKSPNLKEIIEISGVHPLKVRNVYIYGSTVYGYSDNYSDYDVVLVAPGLIGKETRDDLYNIHQVMPDIFQRDLESYNVRALECYFSPGWARLQEKTIYKLEINRPKLISSILSQSHEMWRHSKMKMRDGDTRRGNKSAFHSLKTLIFGIDILTNGSITKFDLRDFHEEFYSNNFYEWEGIKDKYLSKKMELEKELKETNK